MSPMNNGRINDWSRKIWRRVLGDLHPAAKRKARNRRSVLQKLPAGGLGVEIGVWRGEFSEIILRETSPKCLYLIDPWEFHSEFPMRVYTGEVGKSQDHMDRVFCDVQDKFMGHPNVIILRGESQTELPRFEDNYFDWIYIDGNHSYESVLADLRMSLSKTKSNGIIAGDDYRWGAWDDWPVRKAVKVFVEENNLERNLKVIFSQFIIFLSEESEPLKDTDFST